MYDRAKKQNNTEVLQEFARATRDIEHFICVELSEGATTALRTAIKWTWMKNFSAAQRDPAFFFQGTTGSNFISAVQGSLGEFQAAVIFTFLEQTIGRRTAYSTLIGDKLKHGEQLKTDVSIIQGLGLQVKNMNTIENNGQTQLIRDLETNIHPNKLVSYLGENSNFLDFIANYYFNTDFANETQSVYYEALGMLGSYLGEIMNFAMGQVVDTICFYFIGGKYLVPASRILEAAQELDLENSIEITSSYRGLNDVAYELPIHVDGKGKRSPLYVEYWVHPYGSQSTWRPTGKNAQIYNKLLSRDISIRTKFNLFSEIEKYAIF